MFKKQNYYRTILFLSSLLLFSCAKDEYVDEDPSGGNGGSGTNGSFTWMVNNGSSVSANDYFFVSAFNNIVGKHTGTGKYVDITLDNLSTGTYNISASKGILFEYFDGTKAYTAVSGVVTISAKTALGR